MMIIINNKFGFYKVLFLLLMGKKIKNGFKMHLSVKLKKVIRIFFLSSQNKTIQTDKKKKIVEKNIMKESVGKYFPSSKWILFF